MVEKHALSPNDCIKFVQSSFKEKFSKFILTKEGAYTGYWWLEYKLEQENATIYFDGDIGGHFLLRYILMVTNTPCGSLIEVLMKKLLSNKENIRYQLEILKRFFS